MIGQFSAEMEAAASEIRSARERVKKVVIPDKIANPAIKLVQRMGIDSLRAEIAWFESARAYAAADDRDEVTLEDLKIVAPMALRLRRSPFMNEYFKGQVGEEKELNSLLTGFGRSPASKRPTKRASKKK
jgi:magnesium chelatase subunit I